MAARQKYQSDRQLERHANILYTTRKLASKVGYEGLTMRGLAEEAGVSPKTLYNLFHSKDELLTAALEDLLGIVKESVGTDKGLRGIDYILARRQVAAESIMRSPGFANVVVSLFFNARPNDRLVATLLGGSEQETLKHLEYEGSKGRLIEPLNLERVCAHLAAQTWGTLLMWDKGLIELKRLGVEVRRSYLMTFVGITRGRKRKQLEQMLSETEALESA